MCALTALCSVCCVVSTEQPQRLQAGLRLRDRNAIITSKWKQWRSSHLDILDLSRGGRIGGGGKSWPKPVAYEAGGGRPLGLKNSGQTLFSGQAQVFQKS